MLISELPPEAGLNLAMIDGEKYFRVFDLADMCFPGEGPYRKNNIAQMASKHFADTHTGAEKIIYGKLKRKGRYMPAALIPTALTHFSDAGVRKELKERNGALIGSIIKKNKEKAMTTVAPLTITSPSKKLKFNHVKAKIVLSPIASPEAPGMFIDVDGYTVRFVSIGGVVNVVVKDITMLLGNKKNKNSSTQFLRAGGKIAKAQICYNSDSWSSDLSVAPLEPFEPFLRATWGLRVAEKLDPIEMEKVEKLKAKLLIIASVWMTDLEAPVASHPEDGMKPLSYVGVTPAPAAKKPSEALLETVLKQAAQIEKLTEILLRMERQITEHERNEYLRHTVLVSKIAALGETIDLTEKKVDHLHHKVDHLVRAIPTPEQPAPVPTLTQRLLNVFA